MKLRAVLAAVAAGISSPALAESYRCTVYQIHVQLMGIGAPALLSERVVVTTAFDQGGSGTVTKVLGNLSPYSEPIKVL
ncbi:hypothetical protein, partial [Enterococcus faecium]|uniref:hypothetical protein n=1 Tax=Enterococcus faecium TaxID=1352 RepID=UPI003F439452